MKNFLKMMLASACALVIVTILSWLLLLGFVGSLSTAKTAKPILPASGVLVVDMSKIVLAEQSLEANPLAGLSNSQAFNSQGEMVDVIGIWDAIQAVNTATEDPTVQYIYIKSDGNLSSISQLEEFRSALERFRTKSGKAIVSYMETPGTGSYYLASVSDKIYMTSHLGATSMLTGVSSQMFFLGDLLKSAGVNVQLIRHGKYKSAGEMFVRSSSSAENREQNQRMIDSIWETLSAQIAKSRGISVAELNSAIDNLKLVNPQDFKDCSLVDELFSRGELEQKLAQLAMKESFRQVQMIAFADYVAARKLELNAADEIAVIYADGEIVDGSMKMQVAGDRFASVIAQVRENPKVKAVVLRVNSPGGSVLASEKIKAELDSLQRVKPLVASYGGYAASGGFWISCSCDKVFADNTTLTGSIGVFSMVPEFSELTSKKLKVGVESVSSSSHGDMYGLTRPFDSAETAYMQKSVEQIYDRFTSIVAAGRNMPKDRVDALGQGRVWTGADAISVGLADERGGLEEAVLYAASLLETDIYCVTGYPKPQTQMEMLLEMLGESQEPIEAVKAWYRGDYYSILTKKLQGLAKPMMLARMDSEIVIRSMP